MSASGGMFHSSVAVLPSSTCMSLGGFSRRYLELGFSTGKFQHPQGKLDFIRSHMSSPMSFLGEWTFQRHDWAQLTRGERDCMFCIVLLLVPKQPQSLEPVGRTASSPEILQVWPNLVSSCFISPHAFCPAFGLSRALMPAAKQGFDACSYHWLQWLRLHMWNLGLELGSDAPDWWHGCLSFLGCPPIRPSTSSPTCQPVWVWAPCAWPRLWHMQPLRPRNPFKARPSWWTIPSYVIVFLTYEILNEMRLK